ncbi:MAG: HAD-IA family hydrolase [Tissierellia bacterium]|nr:HAD-IA family hydrolase [Tissierellia bacterium]
MKAVIFDMDGVIVDSEPVHRELEIGLLEELGGRITPEEYEGFIGTTDHYMWSTFKRQFDIDLSVEEMVDIKKKRFIENIHRLRLVDHFRELLLMLYESDYQLGLASSNNNKAINTIVERFDLSRYFHFLISGEDVAKGKPDPEIFLKASKEMDIPPIHCLVIEDASNGAKAAKAAGMKCIGFQNPNSGNQDLSEADLIVDSLADITLAMMKNLFK